MNLQEALKIRAVVPCAELRIARHFARVWKLAAKRERHKVNSTTANAAPSEPTDEMMAAGLNAEIEPGVKASADIGVGVMRIVLRAALTVRQKGAR